MPDSTQRPVGVLVLGMLHIAGGSLAAVAVIVGFVLRLRAGQERPGIPLGLLALVAALVWLGPGLGRALLRARPWSWYVTTYGYLLVAIVVAVFRSAVFDALADIFGLVVPLLPWVAPLHAAAAALLALYLFSGSVVDRFGVGRRRRWALLVLELGLAASVVFGVPAFLDWQRAEVDDQTSQLQKLGDRRANSEEDIRLMLDRLEEGRKEERVMAAWALGRSGRGDVIAPLLDASKNDSDLDVRINAIAAVAELGGREVEDDLVAFLAHDRPEIRSAALRGLASEKFDGAVEPVGPLMLDDESLRGLAVDVLGNMGSVEALPFLREVADDPDEDVRGRVAFAFGKLGDRRALATLTGMLDDPRWTVRANAAQALGTIGDPTARAALEELRDDPSSQVRATAEAALGKLR